MWNTQTQGDELCRWFLSRKWDMQGGEYLLSLDVPVIGMEILPYSIVYMMHAT